MTPKDAEKIVQEYAAVLARDTPKDVVAHYESWLPHSREKIVQAMKVLLAYHIQNRSLTKEFHNGLATGAARLPYFFEDGQAQRMNALLKQTSAVLKDREKMPDLPKTQLIQASSKVHELLLQAATAGSSIRCELTDFVSAVQQFDLDDPLYYQRV